MEKPEVLDEALNIVCESVGFIFNDRNATSGIKDVVIKVAKIRLGLVK